MATLPRSLREELACHRPQSAQRDGWQAETAPEWVIDVQDVVAERDRVAVRAVASGTRAERAPGEPYDTPSFQRVEWITIYRIESDLISEAWVVSRTLDVP